MFSLLQIQNALWICSPVRMPVAVSACLFSNSSEPNVEGWYSGTRRQAILISSQNAPLLQCSQVFLPLPSYFLFLLTKLVIIGGNIVRND